MLRKLLILVGVVLATNVLVMAQSGSLKGTVVDKSTKEPIPFASVVIEKGGKQIGGTAADINGEFTIKPIPPGTYDLRATNVGFNTVLITNIVIGSDKITFQDLSLDPKTTTLTIVEVVSYKVPLIDKDQTKTGQTITAEEINKMPGRDAGSIAITTGGTFSTSEKVGDISIKGSRTEGVVTYIDGVKVMGSTNIPKSAIDQVDVMTGGLPASYGDATGGVINIVTKGPSSVWGFGAEGVTSQVLDKYGYNLIGINLYGPLFFQKDSLGKKTNNSLAGFWLSVEGSYIKDDNPSAIKMWTAKDEVLTDLEKLPYIPSVLNITNIVAYPKSEYLSKNDMKQIRTKQNAASKNINLNGKLDFKLNKNTNFTVGGKFNYDRGNDYVYAYSMFNYKNNPLRIDQTWNIWGRLSQKFNTDANSNSILKNVYYQLQVNYTKRQLRYGSEQFGDRYFDYGYLGKFNTFREPNYTLGQDSITGLYGMLYRGMVDTLVTFERSDLNPDLAAYTQEYYDLYGKYPNAINSLTTLQLGNALLNGSLPGASYGLWSLPGTTWNQYQKFDRSQFGGVFSFSADIKKHSIEVGFIYEQNKSSLYNIQPAELWTIMRQNTNFHISELDKSNPIQIFDQNGIFQDTIYYNRLYNESTEYQFSRSLRKKLNMAPNSTEWIDTDNLDPSILSIDMFSADELLRSGRGIVNYYGYDYTGKLLTNKPSFDDFFTAKDENNNFKREIAPFEPIYIAGWIQDKFTLNDLIVKLGLRVDRFDANQKVLKDPFLMYEAYTVSETNGLTGIPDALKDHPSNIGSDYVVYVNDIKNPTSIRGYRNGNKWYNASGTEITDPITIHGSSGTIAPYLKNPDQDEVNSGAFKDYEPQTTLSPRIAFSFPISDVANFQFHYDVLNQRPKSNNQLNPIDYLFINEVNNIIDNPNLQPEKTVDYSLGFQQKLNNSSSLKIEAYYKESRNQIQNIQYFDAYPRTYITYGNVDFSTVKGLILSYDLRRTKNIWIKASYTLQFADGTGSDATSSQALVAAGQPNLRTLFPLESDRRHAIQTIIDFRFGGGNDYNGPITQRDSTKQIKWLENTGVNFILGAGSGTPYSRVNKPGPNSQLEGTRYGSRMPWSYRIDAKIDRDIELKIGKKQTFVNVYILILNVLNTKNIVNVYPYTGNADDDGFLAAAEFQSQINSQRDVVAYKDQYSIRTNSPFNYSLPRRIRLGVSINF